MGKGQITIFIAIALILVIAIGFVVYTQTTESRDQIPSSVSDGSQNVVQIAAQDCMVEVLRKGIWEVGLQQDALFEIVREPIRNCIDANILKIAHQGTIVETGEYSLSLENSGKAITLLVDYPLSLTQAGSTETISSFSANLPLYETYSLPMSRFGCKLARDFEAYTPDRSARMKIPWGASLHDQDGNCLTSFSVQLLDTVSPLSVFKVGYDFQPDGTTISPGYFEVWMSYNQEDYNRVKANHPDGAQMDESELRVAFYDERTWSSSQEPNGRIGEVLRPYTGEQEVDTANNIIHASLDHFTKVYTLTGCEGVTKIYRYNNLVMVGAGERQEGRYTYHDVCTGEMEIGTMEWSVSGDYASCANEENAVYVQYRVTEGDTFMNENGDVTVGHLTTKGDHFVTVSLTDADKLIEDAGCANLDVYVRFEGVGYDVPLQTCTDARGCTAGGELFDPSAIDLSTIGGSWIDFNGEVIEDPNLWPTGSAAGQAVTMANMTSMCGAPIEEGDGGESEGEVGSDWGHDAEGNIVDPDTCAPCNEWCGQDLCSRCLKDMKGESWPGRLQGCVDDNCAPPAPCSDGTPVDSCSSTKPKFCSAEGGLIDDCESCGCSSTGVCQEDGTCLLKCSDGTLSGECSTNKPSFCEEGELINKPTLCGCPSGFALDQHADGSCIRTCADGTFESSCSTVTPGKYCSNGQLVSACTAGSGRPICPCADGATCILSGAAAGQCLTSCSDGTLTGYCSSSTLGQYCSSAGSLIENCNACGCPLGKICQAATNTCN